MEIGEIQKALSTYPLSAEALEEEINVKRALGYFDAVDAGLEPRDYKYTNLPIGMITARLDFKTWGDNSNLCLYLTDLENGKKYRISIFQANQNKLHKFDYSDSEENVDFSEGNLNGKVFELEIEVIKVSKNFRIKKAIPVDIS